MGASDAFGAHNAMGARGQVASGQSVMYVFWGAYGSTERADGGGGDEPMRGR